MGQDLSGAPRSPIDGLRELVLRHRPEMTTVIVYAIFVGLFTLATPIAVQALVNTVAFGTLLQPLLVLATVLVALLSISGALKALKYWAVEVIQRRIFVETISRLAFSLPSADASALKRAGGQHLVHRFFDLFVLQKSLASLLLGGVDVVLAALVGMVVLAFYHPFLLAFDLALIGLLFLVVVGLGRNGIKSAIDESTSKYEMANFLSDVAEAACAYRDRGGMAFAHARVDALAQKYLVTRASHFDIVFRQFSGAMVVQVVASAGLLGLGGWLVIQRELSLGQLVAAELIVTMVVSTIAQLVKYTDTYYELVTAGYKLEGLIALPTELQSGDRELDNKGKPASLSIRDLHTTVGNRTLFTAAELTVPAGAKVALLGPAESGKTYLIDLFFGLQRPARGHIELDGADIRELSRAALRERVAIVHGPEIVHGTVIENIRLGRTDISSGRVRSLLEDLGLAEELLRLPDGLETMLSSSGWPLSTSQALRVTIARAVARSPGLLAIDSPLSSINPESLERVLEFLARPEAPWTLIVVSAEAQVLPYCDRVVRVEAQRFREEKLA
jgi:putative ABC transport system ATP-binding protein